MSDQLFLATPFAGYEAAFYLREWGDGYARMAEALRGRASALWFDNSGSLEFGEQLAALASAVPIPVRIVADPLRLADPSTGPGKNIQVCAAWQRIVYELLQETKDPEAHLLCLESDVVVPPEGPDILLAGLQAHPLLAALSGAVSEGGWLENHGTMAWRILKDARAPYEVPPTAQHISWYDPELNDAIELVDAVPYGCLMVQLKTFSILPMRAETFPVFGHDQEWSVNAWRAGRPVAVHWGVRCEHFRNLAARDGWWAQRKAGAA